ncbi:MAG: ABC transporter substrate-binding protein [Phycisphaeraceae bacterium]
MLMLAGCDRQSQNGPPRLSENEQGQTRIVSLAPALTKMISDLGEGAMIVGVASHDEAAPEGAKVVGDYMNLNTEAVLALRPTHIFMMSTKEGVPSQLQSMADSNKVVVVSYPYPKDVDEVGMILFDESELAVPPPKRFTPPSLGTLMSRQLEASRLKLDLFMRLSLLEQVTDKNQQRPRVLMMLDPSDLTALGRGTVHNDLLARVNGVNVLSAEAGTAPKLDREKLLSLQPEVILVLSPKDVPLKPVDEDVRLVLLRNMDVPAVKNNRIVLIDHPMGLLPSTSMGEIAAAMARAIHPTMEKEIDEVMKTDVAALRREGMDLPATLPRSEPATGPAGSSASPLLQAPPPVEAVLPLGPPVTAPPLSREGEYHVINIPPPQVSAPPPPREAPTTQPAKD